MYTFTLPETYIDSCTGMDRENDRWNEKKTEEKGIIINPLSRRDFIKALGIAVMGVSYVGCSSVGKQSSIHVIPPKKNRYISERLSTGGTHFDVVIIGTGMGGSA